MDFLDIIHHCEKQICDGNRNKCAMERMKNYNWRSMNGFSRRDWMQLRAQ
jgi:hypothetical protein